MASIRSTNLQLYKDVLTLALHTRFIRAAGVILGLCYALSVLMGDKSSCERTFYTHEFSI